MEGRPFARHGKVLSLQALHAQRVYTCVHACAFVRSDQDLAEGQTADVIIILGYALFRCIQRTTKILLRESFLLGIGVLCALAASQGEEGLT